MTVGMVTLVAASACGGEAANAEKTKELLKTAAEEGDAKAQFDYARTLWDSGEQEGAMVWLRKAAAQGYSDAQMLLAVAYYAGKGVDKDPSQSYSWAMKAAKGGGPLALMWAGVCYDEGIGVELNPRRSIEWYEKAAEAFEAAGAQSGGTLPFEIGLRYYQGDYRGEDKHGWIVVDHKKAWQWFEAARQRGNHDAEAWVGRMTVEGHGVERDVAAGLELLRSAARNGSAHALKILAMVYEDGIGVAKDPLEAWKWYMILASTADEAGLRLSGIMVLALSDDLDGEGKARAKELAQEWMRRHEIKAGPPLTEEDCKAAISHWRSILGLESRETEPGKAAPKDENKPQSSRDGEH